MRGWIFDFNANQTPDAAGGPVKAEAVDADDTDWSLKLQAALGDDAALLALTREAAPLDVKLAAVGALEGEAALRQAEREFRNRDRRVHRLAKQRYGARVAQREAGAQAALVIEAARALLDEPLITLDRLVEIDRGWQVLNTSHLDSALMAEYTALMTQLASLTRDRADHELKVKRWAAQAREAIAGLQGASRDAAAGARDRAELAAAGAAVRRLLEGAPGEEAGTAVREALAGALQEWARLDAHLAVLDALLQGTAAAAPAVDADREGDAEAARDEASSQDPAERWAALAPLADASLTEALNERLAQWQRACEQANLARLMERREQAKERRRAVRDERVQALAEVLERAEAALAGGHLAETHGHLVDIDQLLEAGAPAGALRVRIDQLQAQYAQLKGWQHWGGGRARDELVQQAEALAQAVGGGSDERTLKLSLKQQAELIDDMRSRWKELDRLGGATSRTLWQRFDAALKLAYQPVAEQVAVQRDARERNLQARQQLIEELDAVPLPDPEGAGPTPDLRQLAVALDHFQTGWRRLGPIEHTVPHKARDGLVERMNASVQRLEAPLHEARRGVRLARGRLIERARALAADAAKGMLGRDTVDKVRELQAQWQQQARALPLARADENALWTEFKTAIDAIFSAREAVFSARDAEFKAHGAERTALIERLEALSADTPAATLKRTLTEVERQWQRTGPAPRNDAAALEGRFRQARDAVLQWLAGSARRSWQATCDALAAKLALCEELESGAEAAATRATLVERWSALAPLPAPLEQALGERAELPGAARKEGPALTDATDDLLLRLEAAWGLDSPPAFEAARRNLKLLAMKAALETRRTSKTEPATPEQCLAELLRRSALEAPQRERLGMLIAALRQRGSIDAA